MKAFWFNLQEYAILTYCVIRDGIKTLFGRD